MLQVFGNIVTELVVYNMYADKSFYYYCVTNKHNNNTSFKAAVRRRFMIVLLRRNFLVYDFKFKQYIFSFISFITNVFSSSVFTFKKRLKFHGLAFNAELNYLNNLVLNVGYAYSPMFIIPKAIEAVKSNSTQRKLLFSSRLLDVVANFTTTIKDVRPINVYFNPAKRGGRRGIRIYLCRVKRKKFNKDVK